MEIEKAEQDRIISDINIMADREGIKGAARQKYNACLLMGAVIALGESQISIPDVC